MTTINRIGIEGIRSYGPGKEQTIIFTPPLTLILGENGSGKTTIIEALLMATCGALPPNSGSGQAFVHDPRVSLKESTETKGKIRLRFVDNNGYSHTVSRLFSLTNKKVKGGEGSKQQYKQSEASIETKLMATGQKDTITNKCAQIDQLVPELMGVSQAVLQNVIFCHQEESNWIFGDPKTLKNKFDAIFASTRYSKALDHIQLTLRSLREEIKEYEKEEAGEKVHKQRAHEFTQKLREFEHQENVEKNKKIELEEEIKQLTLKRKKVHRGLEIWKGFTEHQKESNQQIKGHEEHLASTLDKTKVEMRVSDLASAKAKLDQSG